MTKTRMTSIGPASVSLSLVFPLLPLRLPPLFGSCARSTKMPWLTVQLELGMCESVGVIFQYK